MPAYIRPDSLDDALAAIARAPLAVLAGGTDFYPARVGQPLDDDVLDITALTALRGIEECPDHVRIGALTTWAAIRDAPLAPWFRSLQLAAREVGGGQIQNAGTIGGNLCNASPAADGIPPLLALDAEVELSSRSGTLRLPLADFVRGNRTTVRQPDQLVTAIVVPKPGGLRAGSHFLKLGARRYLVISIVMSAAALEVRADGSIERARLVIGACSAVAVRLPAAERALEGQPLDPEVAGLIRPQHLGPLAPIDDVRGSAGYRRDAALTLMRRTVAELAASL